MGETVEEVTQTMEDLRAVDCDLLTVGQYLRPSAKHHPIDRFYTPAEFEEIRQAGLAMGFKHVASGPLVRSSYHADEQIYDMDLRADREQARPTFSPPPGLQQIDPTLS